jgi:hypothetical protein
MLRGKTIETVKGIDRSFELRGEIRLIRSVMTNWRLGNFFYLILNGLPQDQQKTNSCRLITFKVTLTGQSHFMRIFLLVKSLYAITTTPYNECTQLVQKILWFN